MHSYQHNIKTFNNATRFLTRVERSLYRDLIELYYDTEQPLPAVDFDRLARRVLANTDDEKAALRYVLDEFFEITGDVYTHEYCDLQIEKYRANQTAKATAGKASAEARKKKAQARRQQREAVNEQKRAAVEHPLNECATNQKPETINHKPLVKKKNAKKKSPNDLDYSSWPEMPTEQVLADWKDSRQKKRAAVSQTVVDQFGKELTKAAAHGYTVDQCLAECITRGWQGFKFEWIQNSFGSRFAKNTNNTGENHESVTDAEFFGSLDPQVAGRLFAQPASDISGLEGRSVGRSSSVDDGIQTPAAKRVC